MSAKRILEVARRELLDQITRPLFWLAVALLAVATSSVGPTALIPSGGGPLGGTTLVVNSQYAMAQTFVLLSFLICGFFVAILAGLSVLRDDEAQVTELLNSSPLRPSEYLLGKLAGSMTTLLTLVGLLLTLALLLFQLRPMLSSPEQVGPFHLSSFLVPALLFALPVLWCFAATSFAVGARLRRPMAMLAVPTALLFVPASFLWGWTPSWLPAGLDRLLMVLDFSALRWLRQTHFAVDRGAEYYNTSAVAFDEVFWLNRALVMVLPAVAVLLTYPYCRSRARGQEVRPRKGRWLRRWKSSESQGLEAMGESGAAARSQTGQRDAEEPSRMGSSLPAMGRARPGFLSSAVTIGRAELKELLSQAGPYLLGLMALMHVWEQASTGLGVFDAPLLSTPGTLALRTMDGVGIVLCLLLLFHIVESLHRDRASGLSAILYSSPLRTGALLLGKGLAGAGAVVATLLACGSVAVLALSLWGTNAGGLWPFFLMWVVLLIPTLLFWAGFVALVQAVIGERYSTYAVCLAGLLGSAYLYMSGKVTWATNWNLWGTLRWSDLGTFSLNREALLANRLLVLGVALVLLFVASRLFARTERDAMRSLRLWQPRLWKPRPLFRAVAIWMASIAPLLFLGSWIALQVRAGYQGKPARDLDRDYWRRNVSTWSGVHAGSLTHLDLELELYPAARELRLAGTLVLRNLGDNSLDQVPMTVGPSFSQVAWNIDGESLAHEDRSGLHLVQLAEAWPPGEELRLGVSYRAVVPQGWSRNGGGAVQFVLPAGVVLHTLGRDFLPIPGYVKGVGMDRDNRPFPRPIPTDFWVGDRTPPAGNAAAFSTRISVQTPAEYLATSVGERVSETVEGSWRTTVWESQHPVQAVSLLAGRWEVERHNGAAIYFHPDHRRNATEMLTVLAAARERFSEWFSPYPWTELRIVEFADLATYAKGFPSNIPFSEGMGFLTRSDARTRLASVVTAHEAAHQWWGNLLIPGDGPGADFLIEGMAHYSAMLLLEAEYGPRARMELCRRLEESYVRQRRVDLEPTLAHADYRFPGASVVSSDKGAWVMWMLHRHLGRESTLLGLREFLERFIGSEDHAAIPDLLEVLASHATQPEAYQAFVDQWFYSVVLPELRVHEAKLERLGDSWRIEATVENVGGGEVEVEVAASRGERFAGASDEPDAEYRDSRRTMKLLPGQPQQLSWPVDFLPERLVIDPDVTVLQRDRQAAQTRLSPPS